MFWLPRSSCCLSLSHANRESSPFSNKRACNDFRSETAVHFGLRDVIASQRFLNRLRQFFARGVCLRRTCGKLHRVEPIARPKIS